MTRRLARPEGEKTPGRDGQLRPAWISAYLSGRGSFDFDGQSCPVFDPDGNPWPPHAAEYRGEAAAPEMIAHAKEFMRKRNYSPERVGACILDAVKNNIAVLPVTPEAWAIYALKRTSPGLTALLGRKLDASARKRARQGK